MKLNFAQLKSSKHIISTSEKFVVDILIRLFETVNKFDGTCWMTGVVNEVEDFSYSLFPVGHPFGFVTLVSKKNVLLDKVVSDGGIIDSSYQGYVVVMYARF